MLNRYSEFSGVPILRLPSPGVIGMETRQTRPSLLFRLRDPADAGAWREFEKCYGDLIVHYARARGLQHCDAEDVRQVVFARLMRTLPRFDYQPQRGRFRGYLGAVVRSALSDWAACPDRAARPVDPDVLAHAHDAVADDVDREWEREWADHHFRRAMAAVRQQVEPGSLRVFEQLLAGRSVEAVATEERMSVEGVRKIRQRIRARLTERIEEQVRDEDGDDG